MAEGSSMDPFLPQTASRKFYDLDLSSDGRTDRISTAHQPDTRTPLSKDKEDLLQYIRTNVIGKNHVFVGPYGQRKVEYCDYTASGRSLVFIEDYIRDVVLPHYGNTHTTTSVSSLQTTLLRHEARDIIRNAVNAGEHDCVLFVGAGSTGAVHKLLHALHLQQPPIVFVGPYEHHSNLLPWREMAESVIRVRETEDGLVDVSHLEKLLQIHLDKETQLIGAFSAASNVTGTLVDTNEITAVLHKYGALAFWDYAAAAPYVEIDINPIVTSYSAELVAKDAVFLSPHKFIGGVQTPGILIAKKKLFRNPVPHVSGGGTIFFVRRDGQRYLQEAEMREEGGTPAVVESVRAGLVVQLKEAVSPDVISQRDQQLVRLAFAKWQDVDSMVLLGSQSAPRIPIFSFLVRHHDSGFFLHYNYVCALLNDLFGIQARGGCACAGPYAEDLLGLGEELASQYEELLAEEGKLDRIHLRRYREYSHREILRPGFTRLNLPYFEDETTISFILEAVKLVAEHGWKLMPQYNFNPETGEWRNRNHQVFRDRLWLGHISYKTGEMTYKQQLRDKLFNKTEPPPLSHEQCLEDAKTIFEQAETVKVALPDQTAMFDAESEKYRWFLLPSEALDYSQKSKNITASKQRQLPFEPVIYPIKPVEDHQVRTFKTFKVLNNKDMDKIPKSGSSFENRFSYLLSSGFEEEPTDQNSATELNIDAHQELHDSSTTKTVTPKPERYTKLELACEVNTSLNSESPKLYPDTKKNNILFSDAEMVSDGVSVSKNEQSSDQLISIDSASLTCVPRHPTTSMVCPIMPKKGKSDPPPVASFRWHAPPKSFFKPFIQAVEEFSMIKNGDRVMTCLSGGKDSLSLLHCLHQYQFYAKSKGVEFELGAVTIDPMTSSYDPSPLKGYLQHLGVPYAYEQQNILETAENLPYECASICSFCSRLKRGRIYHAARRDKFNVLALGQHLDDLSESFLMSVFHNGSLRTMKASYTVKEGDLRVIRPFVFVRETDLRKFAEEKKLPVIAENCPACFEAPKERFRMKQLLAAQEILHPKLFPSVLSAIKPIMSINQTGVNVRNLLTQLMEDDDEQDTN